MSVSEDIVELAISVDEDFNSLVMGDEFEHIEYPPKPDFLNGIVSEYESCRRGALTEDEFRQFLDCDGRLIDESRLRKVVFSGGVDPAIRTQVWQFIFGLYPCNTTFRERDVLRQDYSAKYYALKNRWKIWLALTCISDDVDDQQLTASCMPDSETSNKNTLMTNNNSQTFQFVDIQAQVYAGRMTMTEMESLREFIRIIDKDVPRTDRDVPFYESISSPHLVELRNILVTFATFHPGVGYTQGMNDVLSRFLYVFQNEAEAYWIFTNYLEKIQDEFLEEGMVQKLEMLQQLLKELDSDLYNYLKQSEVGDLMFCHRWIILGFKREFTFDDSLRCFEILSSQHLELHSMEAEQIRNKEKQKDFQQQGGGVRTTDTVIKTEYTFDLFMCVAILISHRREIFRSTECYDFFQIVNSLSKQMDLDDVLMKSEAIFKHYCHKSVVDCFEVVEAEPKKKVYSARYFPSKGS